VRARARGVVGNGGIGKRNDNSELSWILDRLDVSSLIEMGARTWAKALLDQGQTDLIGGNDVLEN
jgi:hypothetical protein